MKYSLLSHALVFLSLSAYAEKPKINKKANQVFVDIDGKKIEIQDEIKIDGKTIAVRWQQEGETKYSFQQEASSWSEAEEHQPQILFSNQTLVPSLNRAIEATEDKDLFLLKLKTKLIPEYKKDLKAKGISLLKYVPHQSFIVRISGLQAIELQNAEYVEAVSYYEESLRSSDDLKFSFMQGENQGPTKYDLVPVHKDLREDLYEELRSIGAYTGKGNSDSFVIEAILDMRQYSQILSSSKLLWIEKASEIEEDMDNVLIQGGANYIKENSAPDSYLGMGIRGHVLEGIDATHQDFQANEFREAPIAVENRSISSHGHATYGIIFGDGSGNSAALGLLPRAQGLYTDNEYVYSNNRRYELTQRLINDYQVMFQTASWGYGRTTSYGSRSAEMDEIIFDLDIPITQSQSNAGSRLSRPQAWAKNIISVGAVRHGNNPDPSDDRWDFGASIGPAPDGRIKPDLVAYYDDTLTTALFNGYSDFGGTSGATPIVAGHVGLTLEMWTNGIFGNELKADISDRFANRPHYTTVKALLINTAKQYDFEGTEHDLTRVHQGWGFPDLKTMYDDRNNIFVVNEQKVLALGEKVNYRFEIHDEREDLVITMTYSDPAPAINAEFQRVNDLDLKVTAPDGSEYYGNHGLYENMFSQAGGEKDSINTVENVILKDPMPGSWVVEVIAAEINEDSHVETESDDADFALVIRGSQTVEEFREERIFSNGFE